MLKEHLVKRVAVGVVAASLAVAGCLGLVGYLDGRSPWRSFAAV